MVCVCTCVVIQMFSRIYLTPYRDLHHGYRMYVSISCLSDDSFPRSRKAHINSILTQRNIQSLVIVVFNTTSRKLVARYVYDLVLFDSASSTSSADGTESEIDSTQLAAIDEQLRNHTARLLASSGFVLENMAQEHAAMQDKTVEDAKGHQEGTTDDELSFDYVIATTGVGSDDRWISADGAERWEINSPVVTPIKDGDQFSQVLALTSRVEHPGNAPSR